MKIKAFLTALVLATALPALAQVTKSFRSEQKFPLVAGGVVALENPVGNIEIVGGESTNVEVIAVTTISGASAAAVDEGKRQTSVIVGGNDRTRVFRVAIGPQVGPEWSSQVSWRVRVPSSASVRVVSRASDRIRIHGVRGSVHVKNFNGMVLLHDSPGHSVVDSVNGAIVYTTSQPPTGNVMLKTLNGSVTATVPQNADFRWVADTARGDIRTNLPARGAFFGTTFRGSINAPGGPTLTTSSLMGNVQLLASGTSAQDAQSLKAMPATVVTARGESQAPAEGTVRQATIRQSFTYATNMGDVRVDEILGSADIHTGAGVVQLGSVLGDCRVLSMGGPLQIGEAHGQLNATTRAGNILVDTARLGGVITTLGGTITVLYAGGPIQLVSGGGDIHLRQATSRVNASTTSGDIAITMDRAVRSERIEAKTDKGNIVLNLHPLFAADVDALIITSNPNLDVILSEIQGLSISKETVGTKTHIRATGKLNGGGERLRLIAREGRIQINTKPIVPTVMQPR
ncbi:MAG TPA: DUF4097 family beta strand repeat-containing protein [Thermoanaerobaculia bacterium]